MTPQNPLLHESPLPYHYPPFDQIQDEHFAPAYVAGMAEHAREIEKIAGNPARPTFENTIVQMERAGQALERVSRIFGNLNGTHTNPKLQAVEKEMAPKLAAHTDAIRLNSALFQRIRNVARGAGVARAGSGIEAADRAALSGFCARGREAFRTGQGEAQGDQCGPGRPAARFFAKRAEGSERVGGFGREPGRVGRAFGETRSLRPRRRRKRRGTRANT